MNFDSDLFTVAEHESVKTALEKIDHHHQGFILTVDDSDAVKGLVTDGDIRRALIRGVDLNDPISEVANADFIWVTKDTPREVILKKLDSEIRFIPVLNTKRELHYVITRDFMPLREEKSVYVRARAPVRVSFGGGGSDLTHYFTDNPGAVINAAISVYSHATMKLRSDKKINIYSLDLDAELSIDCIDHAIQNPGKFGLVLAVLQVVKPTFGFDLFMHSDFPVGSGLGGSAAVSAVILGCLNMFRQDQWDKHELAEIAFQAERLNLGIAGGWQDQYACVFGGFNFIEFKKDQNVVHPIRINDDTLLELEESLVLCDTGISHHSGNVHDQQKVTMMSNDVSKMVKENVELTYLMRNYLLRGHLTEFGYGLDKAWQLKRNFGEMITSDVIDKIYSDAQKNGAIGGKLLGAGGGGFFLFSVSPFKKHGLIKHLRSKGLQIKNFRFEENGLQSWSVRDHESNTEYKD